VSEYTDQLYASKEGRRLPSTPGSPQPAAASMGGRGGAGNMKWADPKVEERKKAEEEERVAARVNERARVEVEALMRPPPKAYGRPEGFEDVSF